VAEVSWRRAGPPPWFDCDTDDDLRAAEEWAR
jgi:molybdopterin-guanine dinucleotide biosynthesis protein A